MGRNSLCIMSISAHLSFCNMLSRDGPGLHPSPSSLQDACGLIPAQLRSISGREDGPLSPGALPVARQQPFARFARMTPARPGEKLLLDPIIIAAQQGVLDQP